jgi:hypothetical protein
MHPVPDAFAQAVRAHVDRHQQDVALLRSLALTFLEPMLPPGVGGCRGSSDGDAGSR